MFLTKESNPWRRNNGRSGKNLNLIYQNMGRSFCLSVGSRFGMVDNGRLTVAGVLDRLSLSVN